MSTDRTSVRRLSAFVHLSLDGYYCDARGDMSFAHKPPDDAEWNAFVGGNVAGDAVLLFGRTTYDLMASFWPTPAAAHAMPEVAARMNESLKVVFSRSLQRVDWKNTRIATDLVGTVRAMKAEPGPDMVILGSGSIIMQLAEAGLLDELQVVVNPVALGGGASLLAGLRQPLHLTLQRTRSFRNGAVVCWYAPAAAAPRPSR